MKYTVKFQVKVNGVLGEGEIFVLSTNLEDACELAQEYLAYIYGSDFVKVLEVS
jgi:hypothetical protein